MSATKPSHYRLLSSGGETFPEMLHAIGEARKIVRLETYIYSDGVLGRQFLDALVEAASRAVQVRVLIDAFGSLTLPESFWDPLKKAGGEVRWFNPPLLKRFGFRDHRKMLVCDDRVAFVGGFNISDEYNGDGIHSGWCDLGLMLQCPLVSELSVAFDDMFIRADTRHRRFTRFRRSGTRKDVSAENGSLLLSGPGRGHNPFTRNLRRDLNGARDVRIICAYFLPTRRIRNDLVRVARNGGRVQLILPAKSDVPISQFAGRSLYRRMLKAGVEIYEYQPQILHAKLLIVDDCVYVGSANLDPRSLYINYELMLRFKEPSLLIQASEEFDLVLSHSQRIEYQAWRKSRTWWRRLRARWSYFLLVRVDPVIARWRASRTR